MSAIVKYTAGEDLKNGQLVYIDTTDEKARVYAGGDREYVLGSIDRDVEKGEVIAYHLGTPYTLSIEGP